MSVELVYRRGVGKGESRSEIYTHNLIYLVGNTGIIVNLSVRSNAVRGKIAKFNLDFALAVYYVDLYLLYLADDP